jgi:hypothetical protein
VPKLSAYKAKLRQRIRLSLVQMLLGVRVSILMRLSEATLRIYDQKATTLNDRRRCSW